MDNYKIDLQANKKSHDGSIMGKIHDFQERLKKHENLELNVFKKSPLVSPCDSRVNIYDRHKKCKVKAVMFGSNCYTGAIVEEKIIQKAMEVTKEFGIGSGGVPLLSGTTIYQNELERIISETKGFDDAIVFSSGFAANLGTLLGLLRPNNLIIHDKFNHASLIDGTIMSGAKMLRYKHNNPDSLEKLLKENHTIYPDGILVATDGVFSMDGDIANIPAILEVVRKYNAILLIDDAHATGVIGEKGAGTLSHFKISDRKNIIVTGTLSKAIGTVGGFVAASQEVIDYLRIFARSNMYSTALPPSVCASASEVFRYIKSTDVVDRLSRNAEYLRTRLTNEGFNILNSQTPIIPIIVSNEFDLTSISKDFSDNGIIANYIFPPVVPPNLPRIRVSIMATHTQEDMDYFMDVLLKVDSRYSIRKQLISAHI